MCWRLTGRPWAVVNAAGYVRVDQAEHDPDACARENCDGPVLLAEACRRLGARFVTFSTDLVFDGTSARRYVETDLVNPLNAYGASKARAEREVQAVMPSSLVIRTSAFFSPADDYNFVTIALRTLARGDAFAAASDLVVSPTYVPDLVNAALDLLCDGESGLWHLANEGEASWADLARAAARLVGLDDKLVEAQPAARLGLVAARPPRTPLGSERASVMPPLEDALSRYSTGFTPSGAVLSGQPG